MGRGASGAWDERFHAIFSAANVDELVGSERGVDLATRARKFWMELRGRWVSRFSWAIPDREAVASYGLTVEVGAGNGYRAYLLEQAGADVDCCDSTRPGADEC